MNEIIDTNILYYKLDGKSKNIDISNRAITSINALEFLKNIEKKHNNRAKYHIPLINSIHHTMAYVALAKEHNRPINKRHSDSIIFDFKQDFESYTFYNNESIAQTINNNLGEIFNASILFLEKETYKDIKSKYRFLVENKLMCLPIDSEDIELSYNLLELFIAKHSLKEDFRNCWNDLLILAKAINTGSRLITSDKLLNRFASEIYECEVSKIKKEDIIVIQFPKIEFDTITKHIRKESKNYINRGWDYKIRKISNF